MSRIRWMKYVSGRTLAIASSRRMSASRMIRRTMIGQVDDVDHRRSALALSCDGRQRDAERGERDRPQQQRKREVRASAPVRTSNMTFASTSSATTSIAKTTMVDASVASTYAQAGSGVPRSRFRMPAFSAGGRGTIASPAKAVAAAP